jgi:hypothetical protein
MVCLFGVNKRTRPLLLPAAPTAEALDKLKVLGEKYGQEFYPPDYLG